MKAKQTETVTLNHNLPLSFISKSEGCRQSNGLEEYKWWQPSLLKGRLMQYGCFPQIVSGTFSTFLYGDMLKLLGWVPNEPICGKAEVNFKKRTSVQSLSTHFPQL